MEIHNLRSIVLNSPFYLLRKHITLSRKRSALYERNKAAKVILSVLMLIVVGYLMFISIALALIANDMDTCAPYEMFFGILPFLLLGDFVVRFVFQQTPAQLIKPYSLLPISKYTCVNVFIVSGMLSASNLIWLAITIPYSIMTILFREGFFAALGLVVSFQICVVINSLWYMLVRTLINKSMKWWIFPILFYVLLFSPLYFSNFDLLFDTFAYIGKCLTFWYPIGYACLLIMLFILFEINKRVQYYFTYLENANHESVRLRTVYDFNFFNRYGNTGQYLKLEIKSIMRNKNIRKSFIFTTILAVIYTALISFTEWYEYSFMRAFCLVFVFVSYGAVLLAKIMSAEGNYIDGLMIHKENIFSLLKAKYYFYATVLLIPFLLLLTTVFAGKASFLLLLSMACFTAGPVYCLLMQLAVYNCQTIPLNVRLVSKGNIETNYFQVIVDLMVMFIPVIFILLLENIFSEDTVCLILLVIGILFIAFHHLWIKNIYMRFMRRRYKNMEGFRATI